MTGYLAAPLAFPDSSPRGFTMLEDEPQFDPVRHLQIEYPTDVLSLAELGYSDEEIAECPTDFAVTSIFRILSDEGIAAMLETARKLEQLPPAMRGLPETFGVVCIGQGSCAIFASARS